MNIVRMNVEMLMLGMLGSYCYECYKVLIGVNIWMFEMNVRKC